MTSALSPRDIQNRIRSGASLEDVAQEAGVPAEKVEPYAAPVLAEREHIALTALQCPVRRRGETGSVRAMGSVVEERLGSALSEQVKWDAWRNEDRRWTVRASYDDAEGNHQDAHFIFDMRARFSVAQDDPARELIGEVTAANRATGDPTDAEPTVDLNDELALVRAVQTGSLPGQRPPFEAATPSESREPEPEAPSEGEDQDFPADELEEVDGVYDFVPKNTSDMDVLYEMLSSFAEDSVNIYAGLASPVTQQAPSDDARAEEDTDGTAAEVEEADRTAAEVKADGTAAVEEADENPAVGGSDATPGAALEGGAAQVPQLDGPQQPVAELPPAPAVQDSEPQLPVHTGEADQEFTGSTDPAVDAEPVPDEKPAPKPRPRSRKKRASIPSWDEIMFGGPTNEK